MPDKAFRSRRTEFRAADPAEGQPMTLSGYFVVFGQPYYIDDWCEEVVDRHAFDDADMTDVRALIDHDPRLCLGRHNDNVETLEFSIDDQVPIQGDGAGGRHLDGAGHQLRIYEGNAPGQRPDGGRH